MVAGMANTLAKWVVAAWYVFCAACGVAVLLLAGYSVKWVAAEYGLIIMAGYAVGWCIILLGVGLWIDNRAKQ